MSSIAREIALAWRYSNYSLHRYLFLLVPLRFNRPSNCANREFAVTVWDSDSTTPSQSDSDDSLSSRLCLRVSTFVDKVG